MSVVSEAIEFYHQLLASDPEQSSRWFQQLNRLQLERKVSYENKSIPTLLRPHFIPQEQVPMLERSVRLLAPCFERMVDLFCTEPEVRTLIPFPEEWHDLLMLPGGHRRNILVARFDGFVADGQLKYTEYNTDSPASVAWNEAQQKVFLEMTPVQKLAEKFELIEDFPTTAFFAAVTGAYRDFGLNEPPRLLVTDWKEVLTRPEFELIAEYFEVRGIPATIADPRDLEFRDGALWAGDFRANLVVRRVILRELAERREQCQGIIEAQRSGTVCFANPFRSKIAGNKGCFAFMHHPKSRHLFSSEEHEAIREFIPWTAVLEHSPVEFRGNSVDPFDVALKHRPEMILKPMNRYGGKGVTVGHETSETDWLKVLGEAESGGWCVQERVAIPEEDFPVTEPEFHLAMRRVNLNPFSIAGQYAGSLIRISPKSIINVSGGGAQIPSFVLGARKS